MNFLAHCRAGMLAAGLLALTGCTSLPTQSAADLPSGWHVVQQQSTDARLPHAPAGTLGQRIKLGEVTIAHDAASVADNDALEDLRSALAEQLRRALKPADDALITMNVRLLEATPVSPVANVITGALLFVPLDTGSIVVEAELLSPKGEQMATRRERVRGDYLDIGTSLSRWGRIRNALGKWAQRCLEETAPPIAYSSNIS